MFAKHCHRKGSQQLRGKFRYEKEREEKNEKNEKNAMF
jgi:hypothetical protein